MQSMPLLLRQTLKTPGLSTFSRTTTTTSSTSTTTAARRPVRIPSAAPRSLFLHAGRGNQSTRGFSVCRRCQFRSQPQNLFPPGEETEGRSKNSKAKEADGGEGAGRDRAREHHPHGPIMTLPEEGDFSKYGDVGAEGQKDTSTAGVNFESAQAMQGPEGDGPNGSEQKGGRLPSNLENRRSRYSKQFSEMMDNVQSNVFVAGQRLNDLTGYSSIEALKRDIQHQEERLRTARLHVREAKEDYASAINRRSTSQREVNELLQRKHAWSSVDLERFTSLYRNDHTNEVAEHEAQEALSKAEREAEEAAGQLSKSILSRYHEEQVWSDKIRRMSTWGTWGLMGVNVLLFLIFQIGVEPWRRKRLVKGFEEKVMEALEKEKSSDDPQVVTSAQVEDSTTPSMATITTATTQDQASTSSDAATPSEQDSSAPSPTSTHSADQTQFTLEYVKPHRLFAYITPPSTSMESWRRTLHDLFSERTYFITQRDLTAVAIQSAAAGAAVMGLIIALIRPR